MARLSLNDPVYVGVDDSQAVSTVGGLEQGYCIVPAHMRFLLLFTFLKKNKNKKVIVFFAACNSVSDTRMHARTHACSHACEHTRTRTRGGTKVKFHVP